MADQETRTVDGALIQGEDGSIYFVPDEVLQKFKVDSDSAELAGSAFAEDVAGFDFKRSLPRQSEIGTFAPMKAITGPFGTAPVSASLGEEPTVVDGAAFQHFRR